MRRRHKKLKLVKIGIIFSFFILMIGFGYSYLSTQIKIIGNVSGALDEEGIIVESGSNPELDFTIPSINRWQESGYYKSQFQFYLKNIGSESFDNYKITLTFNHNIETVNIWNNSYTIEGNKLIITNDSVNLNPNNSIEIGFIASCLNANLNIVKIKMETTTSTEEIDPNKFTVAFNKTNGWGNYTYQYNVTLTNKTGSQITYWQLDVFLPDGTSYLSGWSAIFTFSGNSLIIKNESYNGRINNNSSVSFGLQLSTNIVDFVPDDIKIHIR